MSPACPRCAYDLSGIAGTWTDRCPLNGTCSECGLVLRWMDAYFPDRDRVRGLIEHARGVRQGAWWSVRTLWLVARPWVFWRRVTMAMTPRLPRVFAWSLLVWVALWAAGSVTSNALYLWAATAWPTPNLPPTELSLLNGWTQPVAVRVQAPTWRTPSPASGTTYEWMRSLAPLGVATWNGRDQNWIAVVVAVLAAAAAWPGVFLVLGDTRRLGKLRRGHLLRAVGYSLAFLALLAVLRLVHTLGWGWLLVRVSMFGRRFRPYGEPWSWLGNGAHDLWIGAAILLWVQAWWLAAIVIGFRLRTGFAVWLLLAVISSLTGVLAWMAAVGMNGIMRTV